MWKKVQPFKIIWPEVLFFILILVVFLYQLSHETLSYLYQICTKKSVLLPPPPTSQSHTPKTTIVGVVGTFYTGGSEEKAEELQSDSTTINQ